MTDAERPYHSPLREAQAGQTRVHIVETMIRLLAETGGVDFAVRKLAEAAGVSERTVYRYFPDREALLDAVNDHFGEVMSTGRREQELADLDELARFVPDVFGDFDQHAAATKAAFLINPDPARILPTQQRRTELMIDVCRRSFPDLPEADQRRLGQLVRTLTSTFSWLRMREEFDMMADESGELIGWVVECVTEEVRRTGRVGRSPDESS
ncbi:TetR/AcrR family transcriptional regulator [Ilumatobacter sp.]|uniref:TetR/AcrR family transcriptional regulator n=1 Tax=Ilumatobacter sp. TaxID=1967498 RepID=UPI003C6B7A78